MEKKSVELFLSQLDVRNSVSVSTNLTLLTNLLLNEKQMLLFLRQHDRTIVRAAPLEAPTEIVDLADFKNDLRNSFK